MAFSKCPECGETNFEQQGYSRYFECGFQSFDNERSKRCRSPSRRSASTDVSAEVNRYRLALLDAAHAAETIASDMASAEVEDQFVQRIEELARQMRELAGHDGGGWQGRAKSPVGRFLDVVRRVTR